MEALTEYLTDRSTALDFIIDVLNNPHDYIEPDILVKLIAAHIEQLDRVAHGKGARPDDVFRYATLHGVAVTLFALHVDKLAHKVDLKIKWTPADRAVSEMLQEAEITFRLALGDKTLDVTRESLTAHLVYALNLERAEAERIRELIFERMEQEAQTTAV